VTDQEQDLERFDERVDRVDKLDEPDVEGHRLDKTEPRHDLGRSDIAEADEPDVEAHRFDKFEGRVDRVDP
jgi:hypothetical protein